MLSVRSRAVLAAGMLVSPIAGLVVAKSTGATTPDDTGAESSVAGTLVAPNDTSVAITPEITVLPPDEPWAGLTRSEWEVRSWQWVASMPEDVSPWRDTTGERCGYGQSGPVFFLTGAADEITCVVAEGTAILVSSIGTECSTLEPPPWFGRAEDELRACANAEIDPYTDVQASINGQEVADLASYRITTPMLTLTFPENNVFGAEPGVAQSVSDSYSFIIAPLPPGEYEIATSAVHPDMPEPWAMTVNVVVEAPQVIEPPGSTEPGSTPLGSTAPGSTGPIDTRPDANVQRYCALVQELDEAGAVAFAELEADASATDEDFAEAERQFIEEHRAQFDELREVAPAEIANDIDVLLAAQEQRAAGGEQEDVTDEVAAAEERVGAFEEEQCTTG